jgi:hypothetical protein
MSVKKAINNSIDARIFVVLLVKGKRYIELLLLKIRIGTR